MENYSIPEPIPLIANSFFANAFAQIKGEHDQIEAALQTSIACFVNPDLLDHPRSYPIAIIVKRPRWMPHRLFHWLFRQVVALQGPPS